MDKKSASNVDLVLGDVGTTLRKMASERDALAARVAFYERREEATKVATMLHDKGIDTDIELPELVSRLEKAASDGRLPAIAEAAEMIGPNMSFGRTNNHDGADGGGSDVLTSYLMGSVG